MSIQADFIHQLTQVAMKSKDKTSQLEFIKILKNMLPLEDSPSEIPKTSGRQSEPVSNVLQTKANDETKPSEKSVLKVKKTRKRKKVKQENKETNASCEQSIKANKKKKKSGKSKKSVKFEPIVEFGDIKESEAELSKSKDRKEKHNHRIIYPRTEDMQKLHDKIQEHREGIRECRKELKKLEQSFVEIRHQRELHKVNNGDSSKHCRVLRYLLSGKKLNTHVATHELGVHNLPSTIWRLKNQGGWKIQQNPISGDAYSVCEYFLESNSKQ